MVVVEGHAEFREIPLVAFLHAADELLRRHPGLFGSQHDWRAMRVVGADKVDQPACQPAGAHPDIGLDVAHQMAQVQGAVGVGKCRVKRAGAIFMRDFADGASPGRGFRYNHRVAPDISA